MSGLWLVARREIITRGRTKAFVIGLVVSAVLVAALAFLPKLFSEPTPTRWGSSERSRRCCDRL